MGSEKGSSKMANLKIPGWFNGKPDVWGSYNGELRSIEDYLANKGFKLESAHPGWTDKKRASIFFNIIAETKMHGYYDCIRTWVYLNNDMKTIEWCIQIPAQGSGPAHELFHDTENIKAVKYKAALDLVLRQYKVKQQKIIKTVSTKTLEQMSLF